MIAHHLGVKDYLISLPLLQFLLSKGLKIDKVRKVYKFKQSSFLKSFIENNIKRRAQANNPFIKNAIKLINNAIYGRTLLNKLHYATETKVVNTRNQIIKSFSKPTFRKADPISNSRTLVTYNKPHVEVDSPIYVGFSILEYSKLIMYRFWYDVLVKTYGDRVQYVYSDTDSFIINLETEDIEKEIKGPLAPHLDLSNFPPEHPLYDDTNKGVLGKLKIETGHHFMTEFVGLKPKMYSFKTTRSDCSDNTLKGIPSYRRKQLTFDQYLNTLEKNELVSVNTARLQYVKQSMRMISQRKLALSSYEDKRYYLNNSQSVAYGHPLCNRGNKSTVSSPIANKRKIHITHILK